MSEIKQHTGTLKAFLSFFMGFFFSLKHLSENMSQKLHHIAANGRLVNFLVFKWAIEWHRSLLNTKHTNLIRRLFWWVFLTFWMAGVLDFSWIQDFFDSVLYKKLFSYNCEPWYSFDLLTPLQGFASQAYRNPWSFSTCD